MTGRDAGQGPGFVLDFGRGSREQSQGGPTRDNVHPIRKPEEAPPRAA